MASLTPQMMQSATKQSYQPLIESQSKNLLSKLTTDLGSKNMVQAAGGFSGTSNIAQYEGQVKDVFGKGAYDILKNVAGLAQTGRKGVQDVVSSWRNIIQTIKY